MTVCDPETVRRGFWSTGRIVGAKEDSGGGGGGVMTL